MSEPRMKTLRELIRELQEIEASGRGDEVVWAEEGPPGPAGWHHAIPVPTPDVPAEFGGPLPSRPFCLYIWSDLQEESPEDESEG